MSAGAAGDPGGVATGATGAGVEGTGSGLFGAGVGADSVGPGVGATWVGHTHAHTHEKQSHVQPSSHRLPATAICNHFEVIVSYANVGLFVSLDDFL